MKSRELQLIQPAEDINITFLIGEPGGCFLV